MREDYKIVGMVGLRQVDLQTLEVKRMQVLLSRQGRGHGRKLLKHALNYAQKKGGRYICLDVPVSQIKAQSLYYSLGFQVTHTKIQCFGPDKQECYDIYMRKDLYK